MNKIVSVKVFRPIVMQPQTSFPLGVFLPFREDPILEDVVLGENLAHDP